MPETEAEALLRSGALYPIRMGLRPTAAAGPLIFVGLKHGAVSFYFGDDPSFHFDLEGRWQRCYVDPSHYLRRLDGSTQAIDRPRQGRNMVLDRRTLDDAEAAALDATIRATALDLLDRLDSGAIAPVDPPSPARPIADDLLRAILERIARWDAIVWAEHRRRYRASYGPIPFLPPDSLDALVLQATIGRRSDRGPEARSPEAFAGHCREVAALLGRGIVPYRTLFLAGPDALSRPVEQVEAYLRAAVDVFPMADGPAPARRSELPVDRPHRDGIHAFVGRSESAMPEADTWRRDRLLGLKRVSFGIGTDDGIGSDDTITDRDELPRLVRDAKAAGIALSIVTWIGSDGVEALDETAALIGSLGLGAGDHVYLVDGGDRPESGVGAGPAGRFREREAALMGLLAPLRRESGMKVLPYNPKKQGL